VKLNRLVPTMGALAFAASPAFAFDLAPTDGGALQIDGYVDTITSYTRYDENAPRDGSRFDNLALWNNQFRQGIPFRLDVPGGLVVPAGASFSATNAGLNFPVVGPFGPGDAVGWSYLGGAGTGTGLGSLNQTSFSTGNGLIPGFFSQEAFDLSGGSPSLSIHNWDIQGKEQDQFDFEAAAELKVGWDVTEDVHAQVDLFFSDNNSNASNGGSNVNIDQAFVSWEFADGWTWTTGKQDGFIGWEAWDAPDLYRVNQSNIFAMGGSSIVGTNLAYAPNDEWTITLFLTDGIYGDPLGVKDGEDLAGGLEVSWNKKDANGNSLFAADLDLSYDHNATIGEDAFEETFDLLAVIDLLRVPGPPPGGLPVAPPTFQQLLFFADSYRESVWGADFNIQVDAVENWTFAFEANYINYDIANATGLLAMANFQIPNATFPQSITFMASYYDPNDEDLLNNQTFTLAGGAVDSIVNNWWLMGQDDEELELALAYLTNPVGSDKFGVNFEIRYRDRQDVEVAPFVNFTGSEVTDRDEIAAFLEVIAVIP